LQPNYNAEITYTDEKNISTFEKKKEQQAWIQSQNGFSGWQICTRGEKGKGKEEVDGF